MRCASSQLAACSLLCHILLASSRLAAEEQDDAIFLGEFDLGSCRLSQPSSFALGGVTELCGDINLLAWHCATVVQAQDHRGEKFWVLVELTGSLFSQGSETTRAANIRCSGSKEAINERTAHMFSRLLPQPPKTMVHRPKVPINSMTFGGEHSQTFKSDLGSLYVWMFQYLTQFPVYTVSDFNCQRFSTSLYNSLARTTHKRKQEFWMAVARNLKVTVRGSESSSKSGDVNGVIDDAGRAPLPNVETQNQNFVVSRTFKADDSTREVLRAGISGRVVKYEDEYTLIAFDTPEGDANHWVAKRHFVHLDWVPARPGLYLIMRDTWATEELNADSAKIHLLNCTALVRVVKTWFDEEHRIRGRVEEWMDGRQSLSLGWITLFDTAAHAWLAERMSGLPLTKFSK